MSDIEEEWNDPEFELMMEQEGNIYDVSELHNSDSESVMSFQTANQFYIQPEADLDQIVEQLMQNKFKHVLQLEKSQDAYVQKVIQETRLEVEQLENKPVDTEFAPTVNKVKQEVVQMKFADDLLLEQFEQQKQKEQVEQPKPKATKPQKQETAKVVQTETANLEIERLTMSREDKLSLQFEIFSHQQKFKQKDQAPP